MNATGVETSSQLVLVAKGVQPKQITDARDAIMRGTLKFGAGHVLAPEKSKFCR